MMQDEGQSITVYKLLNKPLFRLVELKLRYDKLKIRYPRKLLISVEDSKRLEKLVAIEFNIHV